MVDAMQDAGFTLDMAWTPAMGDEPCHYQLTLTNHGTEPLSGFSLSFCGPGRVDPKAELERAILIRRLSNFTEVAPPQGVVLAPGAQWEFAVRAMSYPLRHWTDAARAAYITTSKGRIIDVAVGVCVSTLAETGAVKFGSALDRDLSTLTDGIAVVPRPAHVAVEGARDVSHGLKVIGGGVAAAAFSGLIEQLFPEEQLLGSGISVGFVTEAMEPEAYRITFDANVTVYAVSDTGFLYGLITLGQILRAARLAPEHCRFPLTGEITDAPHYGWRGSHIDVARQYYSIEELRQFTAVIAWNKLNRLHIHLTEDEAWRYEVVAYPELTKIGAFRGAGLALPPLLGSGSAAYGGFYTKAELKDLVALGQSYGIVCVPEVDVPGHSYAATVAVAGLRDPSENAEYQSIQGFPNNCLNSAVPRTAEFAETVFKELMEIFPGPWIHVGADEVPDDAWTSSPLARQRLEELGGGGPHELQADFLKNLYAQIRAAGRITGAWEEGAHGGGILPEDSYLVAWRSVAKGAELAAKGYKVVMSPGQAYYLDMALSPDWWEPGASWAGTSSVEHTYQFDPLTGFAAEHRDLMIGVQACIWSEPMSDRRVFHRLVFPRLSAIAETGWTASKNKSWERFKAAAQFLPTMHGEL